MDFISVLRQFRIGPFAIFDIVVAYAGIFLLAPALTKLFSKLHLAIPISAWLWLTFPIAIAFHLALNQNTPSSAIFLDPDEYVSKIIIIFMLFMGLRNIRITQSKNNPQD